MPSQTSLLGLLTTSPMTVLVAQSASSFAAIPIDLEELRHDRGYLSSAAPVPEAPRDASPDQERPTSTLADTSTIPENGELVHRMLEAAASVSRHWPVHWAENGVLDATRLV